MKPKTPYIERADNFIKSCYWYDRATMEYHRDLTGGFDDKARQLAEIIRRSDAFDDLLEALKGILAITDRNHVAWDTARAAIAKAEGK